MAGANTNNNCSNNNTIMEQLELTLNYNGDDYIVIVDHETANQLLNDPEEAMRYVEALLADNESSVMPESPHHPQSVLQSEHVEDAMSASCSSDSSSNNNGYIWMSKRPTAHDIDATRAFLELRRKYSCKFDDRKTSKNTLWQKISGDLEKQGYRLGPGGAERCRQKFANLQKTYLMHIKYVKTTGTGKKRPPPFFEELHSILGDKDKVDPKYLEDSLEEQEDKSLESDNGNDAQNDKDEASKTTEKKQEIKNRFRKCLTAARPRSTNEQIINVLQQQQEHDRKVEEERKQHFMTLERLLKQQNEQREEMLKIFRALANEK